MNRMQIEFKAKSWPEKNLYGLFTVASNTVYMPDNMLNLADHNLDTRLLMRKVRELYRDVCNLVPKGIVLKEPDPDLPPDNFDWTEPVEAQCDLAEFSIYRAEVFAEM